MLYFWYTRFLMRFMGFFALMSFFGVLFFAYYTDQQYEPVGNNAPFMETISKTSNDTLFLDLRDDNTIDEAHRTDKELKSWITRAASESMAFEGQKSQETLNAVRRYFTADGFRQYEEYLAAANVVQSVDQSNYNVNVLIEQPPLLLNSSSIEGVYRWLYQMPVTATYFPKGRTSLLGDQEDVINQQLTVRVQIRRVEEEINSDTLQIESWSVKPRI